MVPVGSGRGSRRNAFEGNASQYSVGSSKLTIAVVAAMPSTPRFGNGAWNFAAIEVRCARVSLQTNLFQNILYCTCLNRAHGVQT